MTLKQWLADARKPDRLGINARAQLKRYGARGSLAMPYPVAAMHWAINDRCATDKHALWRGALGMPTFLRLAPTAL